MSVLELDWNRYGEACKAKEFFIKMRKFSFSVEVFELLLILGQFIEKGR